VRWADHSSRGVLPTVMRRWVWCRNLKNEEAMTRVVSQRHKKKHAAQIVIGAFCWLKYGLHQQLQGICEKSLVSGKVQNSDIWSYQSGISRFESSGMWRRAVGWAFTDVSRIVTPPSSGSTVKNILLFLKTYKPVTNIIHICSHKSWR